MRALIVERAERLARHRSIAAVAMGIILAATQGQRMDDGGAGPVGWLVTGIVVATFLLWASGICRGKALRGILNDEGSDVARRRSLMIGFWNMLAAAVVCYALSYAKNYGPRDAIQIIMSVGISSALISFGVAEQLSSRS